MTPNRPVAMAFRWSISAVFALWVFAPNAHAQSAAGNTYPGKVRLSACNAGKMDIDVFVAQSGKVSSAHIGAADCALIAESAGSIGPAYVGLAFVDARGQWGAARRQDLLPYLGIGALPGIGVLSRANQTVPVRHGNTTVSLPMQILFQPRAPKCTSPPPSASSRLPYNATASQRAVAAQQDAESRRLDLDRPSCETLGYVLNAVAYPDSREITFNNFCEPCDKKAAARVTPEERAAQQHRSDAANQEIENLKATGPLGALVMGNVVNVGKQAEQDEEREREQERRKQRPEGYTRMNWNEMHQALANLRPVEGRPREMPEYLIIRGTVSRVDVSPPGASEHWVNVYFRESPEQASTVFETVYGAFNTCTSDATIFEDMFGPDFRSRMIGQILEVEGEYQRNYCKGWKGSIRVTLARQLHSAGSGKDQPPTGTGISYGDFLKALAKAEQESKKPPVLSMLGQQMAERDQEDNRKRWAASQQSPASYDPQWMGQNIVVRGTVARVEVSSSRPPWITIYFKESPDATFVVCSPYPDMFQERFGPDLSVLIGKTLQAAGQVESPYCGHKVPKGSIRVVESKQWQVQ
jgi:hypothetical protein